MSASQQLALHEPKARGLTCLDRTFEGVDDVIEFIESLPSTQKYAAQSDVLSTMLKVQSRIGDGIEQFFDYTKNSEAYKLHLTEDEFADTWAAAQDVVEANRKRRDRQKEARANILKNWTSPRAVSWVKRDEHTSNFLASVRPVAAAMTFESATLLVNCAIISRFLHPAKGVIKFAGPISGDFEKVRKGTSTVFEITAEALEQYGLRYGPEGFLEKDDGCRFQMIEGASELEASAYFPRPAGEIRDICDTKYKMQVTI